jgi:hypothetical protein
MNKRLNYLSKGLTDSKAEGDKSIVGFIHETVKDFMLTRGLQYIDSKLTSFRNLRKAAHNQLARVCIDYISTKEICSILVEKVEIPSVRFNFLDYAVTYWVFHAEKAEREGAEKVTWPAQNILDL